MDDLNLKAIIETTGFRFNKGLGQNFICDSALLADIVCDSGVTSDDVAVEIGTGGGTLTRALADKAKKVCSFEVDTELTKVLDLSLKGLENVEVIFKDALNMSDEELTSIVGGGFKLVANLPYYITTPMIMRFLESTLDVDSLTVMVQKEVADRLVAKVGSPDYAAITLAVQTVGEARITRYVDRKMFYPVPNVDSAVVHIDVDRHKLAGEDVVALRKLIRSAFAMRRKTLVNNLSCAYNISKGEAIEIVEAAGKTAMIRGEALSLDEFILLNRVICERIAK